MKILAIGNSFSQDATRYLQDIAASAGENLFVRNLYIGGCTLEQHVGTLAKSTPSYDFYLNKGGKWTKTRGTIPDGLRYADWDVVTLQQASGLSGVEASSHYSYRNRKNLLPRCKACMAYDMGLSGQFLAQ